MKPGDSNTGNFSQLGLFALKDEEFFSLTFLVFHKPSCMEHFLWLKISNYSRNTLQIIVSSLYIQGSNIGALCMQPRIESFIKETRFWKFWRVIKLNNSTT